MKVQITEINIKLKDLLAKMENLNQSGWNCHLEGMGNTEVMIVAEQEKTK